MVINDGEKLYSQKKTCGMTEGDWMPLKNVSVTFFIYIMNVIVYNQSPYVYEFFMNRIRLSPLFLESSERIN